MDGWLWMVAEFVFVLDSAGCESDEAVSSVARARQTRIK